MNRDTSTAISCSQKVIKCEACNNPLKNCNFCNSCQVSLCKECINKRVEKNKSITNNEIWIIFPECEYHPHHRCEGQCQQCDVPVCIKCIIKSHQGHTLLDIENIYNDKKEEIQKETQEIKSKLLPKCTKYNEDTDGEITKSMGKYVELEKEIEKQRKVWHQEVDNIFNKLSSITQSKKVEHLDVLKSHQSKLKNLIADMNETVKENQEMLKSNKVSQVTSFNSRLKKYRDIPEVIDVFIPLLKTNAVQERELGIELGEYKARLTWTSMKKLLVKSRVIATFPTGVKPLLRVVCAGDDKCWVSEKGRTIRCVEKLGSLHDTVTPTLNSSSDSPVPKEEELICISVNKQGDLIYSDYNNRTVSLYRHGRSEVVITTPNDWKPAGLCTTRSGDILVNLYNGDQNKIVRYQGEKVKQEIFKDENDKPIYGSGEYMLFVAENSNGDICASDRNSDALVVLDKTGRFRFQYYGTPAKRKETFNPNELVTDSLSQIIVTDWTNDCLHIIDHDGQFLRCVDDCDLSRPRGLSFDSEGKLWVGLYETGEVKVIQYTE